MLQLVESMYFHAKSNGMSMKDIYDAFINDSSIWDMKLLVTKHFLFLEELQNISNNSQKIPLNMTEVKDWKYIYILTIILTKDDYLDNYRQLDWTTEAIGTFFIKNLNTFKNGGGFGEKSYRRERLEVYLYSNYYVNRGQL